MAYEGCIGAERPWYRTFAVLLSIWSSFWYTGSSGCSSSVPASPGEDACGFSYVDFEDPPAAFRPWVRWWWPGGDVADAELAREVDLLCGSYFGGAELQAFDAGLDPNASALELQRRRSYASESYYAHLDFLLARASDRGLTIDLTIGSGWPSGGVHISPEHSLKTMLWAEHTVQGPSVVRINVREPDRPVFYLVGSLAEQLFNEKLARYEGARAQLIAVVAARITRSSRCSNPLYKGGCIDLDPASVRVLSDQVDDQGMLSWEVPEGMWKILVVFHAPDGEYPMLNAQPEPGYVADHLDSETIAAHLDYLFGRTPHLFQHYGSTVRGLFNDSLEFKAERLCAADIIREFIRLRGYDPTVWLPTVVVPGTDNTVFDNIALKRKPVFTISDQDWRIRYDYAHTVSDLFIERFIRTVRKWAGEHSLVLRAQGYGAEIDIVRAAGEVDIPETEQLYAGGSELFLKLVASGALLYRRPVVSAEAMVWMNRAYMTTPFKMKISADKLFTAGINHIVFHGFPYTKDHSYGQTGWYPFASPYAGRTEYASNISEADPFWPYMARLNHYIARCQYALRQGSATADLLVYYPWLGFPTTFAAVSGHKEFLFNGFLEQMEPEDRLPALMRIAVLLGISEIDPRIAWLQRIWPYLKEMQSAGYSWAWANDESIEQAHSRDGYAVIRGSTYKGILVLDTPTMQPAAAQAVASLALNDVPVLLAGRIPRQQPGFKDYLEGDNVVADAMEVVLRAGRTSYLSGPGDGVRKLDEHGIEPTVRFLVPHDTPRYTARDLGSGRWIFFFQNQGASPVSTPIRIEHDCNPCQWIDVWNERAYRNAQDEDRCIVLSLAPYGSGMLLCGLPEASVLFGKEPLRKADMSEQTVADIVSIDQWGLTVKGDDVPGGEVNLLLHMLPDWRDIDALRFSSSPGTYSGFCELQTLNEQERLWLRVAWVHGAAEVYVNGRRAGSLLVPPYELEVTNHMRTGTNQIDIMLIPALRNRLLGKALQGDQAYRQFSGKANTLVPVGIVGPVAIEVRR